MDFYWSISFLTLGSLIKFCDCLTAGGTSRKNYGEVLSSFILFNFTPYNNQATVTLSGDISI
jgi:bifunctional UDP-N-acetylglucosamine pyrophosphorylase/glucosamine-1-phosphate N-acetyltransferase